MASYKTMNILKFLNMLKQEHMFDIIQKRQTKKINKKSKGCTPI